jgi:hypothetical protein
VARGSQQAQQGATQGLNLSTANAGEAAGVYGALAPQLESQMAHPAGFAPATLAAMDTGAEQSAGGAAAGAVGQGALRAARTRNAGGANAATAASTRAASETLSKGLLGTQLAQARLEAQQQEQAEQGLGNLFGQTTGASVNSLGEVAQNVNANVNQENESYDWAKDILDPVLSAAGGAYGAYKR